MESENGVCLRYVEDRVRSGGGVVHHVCRYGGDILSVPCAPSDSTRRLQRYDCVVGCSSSPSYDNLRNGDVAHDRRSTNGYHATIRQLLNPSDPRHVRGSLDRGDVADQITSLNGDYCYSSARNWIERVQRRGREVRLEGEASGSETRGASGRAPRDRACSRGAIDAASALDWSEGHVRGFSSSDANAPAPEVAAVVTTPEAGIRGGEVHVAIAAIADRWVIRARG